MERKRRSKASMYRIIERWQSSGLSQSKFCREEKLPKSAFGYWLRKYKKEKGLPSILKDKTPDRFIRLRFAVPCLGMSMIVILPA